MYDCTLCGELGHAEEDCHLHDYGSLIDRVFDQIRDDAMVLGAPEEISPPKDGDN